MGKETPNPSELEKIQKEHLSKEQIAEDKKREGAYEAGKIAGHKEILGTTPEKIEELKCFINPKCVDSKNSRGISDSNLMPGEEAIRIEGIVDGCKLILLQEKLTNQDRYDQVKSSGGQHSVWKITARIDGQEVESVKARELWDKYSKLAIPENTDQKAKRLLDKK